jgi:hypothetical protein
MVLAHLKSNVKLFEFLKYIGIIGMYIISMSFIYEFFLFIYAEKNVKLFGIYNYYYDICTTIEKLCLTLYVLSVYIYI